MKLWSVEDLGRGTYLFHWNQGFYLAPFAVTAEGVVAVDPINRAAAAAYREAIATVSSAPVRAIVYSHDHRDHIVGASELAPEAEIIAHEKTRERILARRDPDVLVPSRLVGDGDTLRFGDYSIDVRYFGPGHSSSSLAMVLPCAEGRLLVLVDMVEPGVAPYRNMPDTDFAGLRSTLDQCAELPFDRILGGHAGPAGPEWVTYNRDYFTDLLEATKQAYEAAGPGIPLPGEDSVAMTQRIRDGASLAAAQAVRHKYGNWRGFDAWAPMTADRVISYLVLGN